MLKNENATLPLRFERRFQLWSYGVSMGLLLLRSTPSDNNPTRLDVLFYGVSELKVPRGMTNLSIDLIPEGDPLLTTLGVERKRERHVFALTAADYPTGFVTAWSVAFAEDDLEFDAPCALEEHIYWDHVIRSGRYK